MKGNLFRRFASCLYLHIGEVVFYSRQDMKNTLKKGKIPFKYLSS